MPDYLPLVIPALLLINLWTILRFWQDKQRAITGDRRIAENDLLGLARIGGSPGAMLARHLFRHKTRKEPFSTILLAIVALQAGLLIAWLWWRSRATCANAYLARAPTCLRIALACFRRHQKRQVIRRGSRDIDRAVAVTIILATQAAAA